MKKRKILLKPLLVLFLLLFYFHEIRAQNAPTFTTTPVTTGTENVLYSYPLGANDADNNPLTFSTATLPSWLTLTQGQNSTTDIGGTTAQPGGVAGDDNGNIYVASRSGTEIYKIDPSGNKTLFITRTSNYGNTLGMAVYQGYLYVSDLNTLKITKISLTNPTSEIDVLTQTSGTIAITFHNGFLYAAHYGDHSILKFDPNLAPAVYNSSMKIVDLQSEQPFGLAFDNNNNLYITLWTNGKVVKYNGSVLSDVLTGFTNPSDIKIDLNDNLYISFYGSGVRKYISSLSSFTQITASGQIWGMTLTSRGTLIYGIYNQNKVVKLETGAILSGTPTHADVGVHPVSVNVSDGTNIVNQSFNITVTDPNPPTVTTYSPVNATTNVSLSTDLTLTFNETVHKGTGNIYIKKTSDNSIVEQIDVNSSNVTVSNDLVTINPTAGLPSFNNLYVMIDAGAILDNSNNAYAGISLATTWTFETEQKIAQTITMAPTATAVYGATDIDPAATSSNTSIPVTYSSSDLTTATIVSGKVHILKAGVVTITASQAGDATYSAAADVIQTLTISPAPLTATADNKTRFENTANPVLTITYSGFIPGEDASNLTTQPVVATTATITSPIADYPITVSGGASDNYSFTYVAGTLSVVAGAQTDIILAQSVLPENSPVATLAGTLSSTSADPSATYTYALVSGAGSTDNALFSIAGDQLKTTAALNFEQKSSYAIRVRSTTQNNQSLEKELVISVSDVNEIPTLNTIANQTLCFTTALQSITLSGISAGPETNQTTTLAVNSSNAALFETLTVTPGASGTATLSYRLKNTASSVSADITVTVKDNGGTGNGGIDTYSRTFSLSAEQLPVISIESDKGIAVSKGATAILTASGGTSYTWANAEGIIGGQNSATLTVRPSVSTTYTVTVTNASGCTSTQSITLTILADYTTIDATNIMSPNGDGVNDTWVIKNIDMYPNNEVKLYDRAGRLLFSQKNYTNTNGWDGRIDGSALTEGTYFYVIDFGNGQTKFKGFITVLREK